MTTIRLAEGLTIPLDQTPEPIGLIGRRGSGKTYAANKLAEEFLDAGLQSVVLDPVGTWYSLRLAADGKAAAYSIPVLGGQHGDIPLEPSAGKLIAKLVAEKGLSVILDVSEFLMAEQRRFVADFAVELLRAKKLNKSALMLFMEEAQEFAPQMSKGSEAMLGAVTRVVKLGRNFGIVPVLITQRPQAVSKEVLNQTELLLAFQTTGPHERKAIDAWVQEKDADRAVIGELPGLETGECIAWSPGWLRVFGRFQIDRKKTFDASATPGAAPVAAASLSDIDLEAVRTAMAATIEKAKADDPMELRKRIHDLERALKQSQDLRVRAEPEIRVERVEVPVFSEADEERIAGLEATLTGIAGKLGDIAADVALLRSQVREARHIEHGKADKDPAVFAPARPARAAVSEGRSAAGGSPAPSRPIDTSLGKGERTVLAVLAQFPQGRTHSELAFLAGYSAKASTLGVILAKLRRAGLVAQGSQPIQLTAEGLEAAGGVQAPLVGQELLDHWRSHPRMGAGERKVLDTLRELYPEDVSHERLCELTDYSPTASTMGVILSKLRKLGLVEQGRRRLAPEFMEAVEEASV